MGKRLIGMNIKMSSPIKEKEKQATKDFLAWIIKDKKIYKVKASGKIKR